MPSLDQILCRNTVTRPYCSTLDHEYDSVLSDSNTKPNSRRCNIPDCHKTAKRGGRCISHGGGNKCTIDGCNTSVVSRGLCVAHGGGKRCQTLGCTKSAQSGGFCWVHGGGKKCGYDGCSKRAQSGGSCIAHGGGKRCRIDNCNKVVQFDGLCVGHGGYRRCAHEKCDRRAMANDYCQQHGGSSFCTLEHCCKRAVRGGMCSRHKAEASLQAATGRQLGDEGCDRYVDTLSASNSLWRARSNMYEHTTNSPPELYSPNTSDQPYETITLHSESPIGPSLPTQRRRGDTPKASGLSALLRADDHYPNFTSGQIETSQSMTEGFNRRQNFDHQPPPPVFPVLPSIQALQNYRNRVSILDKSPCLVLDSSVMTQPFRLDHRLIGTHDQDKQTLSSEMDNHRDDGYDIYVDSCYYKNNSGFLPCPTTLSRRQEWGR